MMSSISEISGSLKDSLDCLCDALQTQEESQAQHAWKQYKTAKGMLCKHMQINHLDKKAAFVNALILRFEYDLQHLKLALDHTRDGCYMQQLKVQLLELQKDSTQFFKIVSHIKAIQKKI
ncbi:MAG: hypothetical protein K940chlam8_00281 [Chlamydiae bacterium]|nr:hypothetical protein [Chlamydiota bacterium]